jgi:hypothetical protein
MRHVVILLVHLITAVLRLVRPGGVRAIVAESVLAKHQLLILDRSRRRAPNLQVCCCRDEAAQSNLGMSAYRRSDNLAFGTSINKDVVRRILALHYRPMPTERGPCRG